MSEEVNTVENEQKDAGKQADQGQEQRQQQQESAQSTDYRALYKTDKAFQGFVDDVVRNANETAVDKALKKQQRLQDERLSESERLKEMTSEQRAQYFEQKYKDEIKARERYKEIESLKSQTVTMLSDGGIPDVFLDVFDFNNATAEDIRQRVDMLANYEYYPRGEIDKRVMAAVNERLKQAAPETRGNPNNEPDDLFLRGFDGK